MRKAYRIFLTIEFVFMASLFGAFIGVGLLAVPFGFQMGQWTEWKETVASMFITLGAVLGGVFGLYVALGRFTGTPES